MDFNMKSLSNYRRGVTKEYEWMRTLKDLYNEKGLVLNKDYIVQRSAGSHSPFDVVLWDFKNGEIHAYQIKYLENEKKVKQEFTSEEFKKFEMLPSFES